AFDNRGFGFSGKPATGYDKASYARLTVALLDALHLPDAVLIGHSMGGAIAAEVAIAHPERVRGLVLIGSAGLGARRPLLPRAAFLSVPGAGHAVQEEAPDEVNRLLIRFLKDGLPRIPGDLALRGRECNVSSTVRLRK